MSFLEFPRFPEDISEGASGGPTYRTSTEEALSGVVYRNADWSHPLHTYDVGFITRELGEIETVLNFFHECRGPLTSFRFKDYSDYKSGKLREPITNTDQQIGVGDGTSRNFQLVKNYVLGNRTQVRPIYKPVGGTVLIAVDGVATTDWSTNNDGLIRLTVPPAAGAIVTAGYEFDVPVFFEDDQLISTLNGYDDGSTSIRLREDRLIT